MLLSRGKYTPASTTRSVSFRVASNSVRPCATRHEAERLARGFGKKHAVDVWYSDAGTYRLLETYRARTSPRTAAQHTIDIGSKD
jgi:hypothetical protein